MTRFPAGRRGSDRALRALAVAGVLVAGAACLPRAGGAQAEEGPAVREPGSPWRAGVGAGWSYYSLASRGDEGITVAALGSYTPTAGLRLEGSVRSMRCPDCGRFVMAEGGLQLRLPLGEWFPFLSGGVGVTSDPDLVGTREHLHAGVGVAREPGSRLWGVQFEVRGRQLDPGNRMVEVSLGLTFRGPGKRESSPGVGSR